MTAGRGLRQSTNSSQIDHADLLRVHLWPAAFGQQAVRLLLHIRYLRVAIAVDVRRRIDRGRDLAIALDELLFVPNVVAVAPAGVRLERDAAVLADDDRLARYSYPRARAYRSLLNGIRLPWISSRLTYRARNCSPSSS